MLGVAIHALHLALIVLGTVGVAALLLPQLLTRSSGPLQYHAPATLEEHENRLAALRSAVRSGTLTTLPGPAPLLTRVPPAGPDRSSWRFLAVTSTLAAAAVHVAVFPAHLRESVLLGAFFCALASAQVVWALMLTHRATHGRLVAGLLANLLTVVLWALTRTLGLPLGLLPGREPVGAWDLAAVTWELVVVACCLAGLRQSFPPPAPHGRHPALQAPAPGTPSAQLRLGAAGASSWAWVLASAAVLVLLTATVPVT